MGEYLRSALNTLSANWANQDGLAGSYGELDSELLGTCIELKGQRLRFERVISVGGFGYVFRVKDTQTQKQFALKRLIAGDQEAASDVRNEIQILNKLQTHAHIMRSYSSMQMPNSNVFYILTEFCACGSLSNLSLPITNSKQLNRILYQTANAIAHMHLLGVVHRDIKIENILFDNKGFVKLCDFGSATEESHCPNDNWTAMQRSMVEDEYTRKTTPMYRPPEILDLYLNYRIDKPMDVWAFGCMLFLIKFGHHPFEDSSKLRILNGKYSIPTTASNSDVHCQLINSCLQINPDDRVKIEEVIELLENNFVDLIASCVRPKQTSPIPAANCPNSNPIGTPGSAQSVSQALSGFTKYLKDTSSKVLQTVQQ
jgi:cyclin G-associated kinase